MRTNRTALVLIEEGILLLRKSPALVFALYCAGTVPFLLALLSFCAEMSYNRNADDNCAASAVAVALTYCWMKGLQAFCCRELVRVYTGNVNRWWKPTTMLAIWSRQIAFHPLGFFIKPLAWLLVFPVSYVSAFFQNLTVLGAAEWSDMRKSWDLARLWPKQSYAVSVLLSLLALIVFFDLYAAIFFVAFILKTLLGIESFLTRSYTWAFSPVLLIAIAAIAYFLIDLLTKAIEVIRCCDGESLATGADLLRRLATLQNPKPGNGANLRALSGMFLHPEGVQRTRPGFLPILGSLTSLRCIADCCASRCCRWLDRNQCLPKRTADSTPHWTGRSSKSCKTRSTVGVKNPVRTELRLTQSKNRYSNIGWCRSAKCCIPWATGPAAS